MNASWNEVAALATKAACGAGAPPAQATSFGRACACHLAQKRPEDQITSALGQLPDGPVIDLPLALHAMLAAHQDGQARGKIPAFEYAALLHSYLECLPVAARVQTRSDLAHVTLDINTPAPRIAVPRVILSRDLYFEMQTLAARTFVPETEASRLSGAGAGLTDND